MSIYFNNTWNMDHSTILHKSNKLSLVLYIFIIMLSKVSSFCRSLMQRSLHCYGITPQFMHPLDAELLLDESPKSTKRTKTVCTIGYLSTHTDQKLSHQTMLVCWLTKVWTLPDSISHMVITPNISDRWSECDRHSKNDLEHTPPSCWTPRDRKSELARWWTTSQSSSKGTNCSS